jgi:hypothetical protein
MYYILYMYVYISYVAYGMLRYGRSRAPGPDPAATSTGVLRWTGPRRDRVGEKEASNLVCDLSTVTYLTYLTYLL